MKRALFYSLIFIFSSSFLFAQRVCDIAIVADKEVVGPIHSSGKPDADLAVKDSTGLCFEKEHSVAWFTFVIPEDTLLTFDLLPSVAGDDIDFLLFKDEKGNFCKNLRAHKARPVRSNLARCDRSVECKTGLSSMGKYNYEGPGNNPSYSNPLKVKKGERYYLAVDNYSSANRSFVLLLHLRWKKALPLPKKPEAPSSTNIKLNITIADSEGHLIKGRLKIAGATRKEIDTSNTSNYHITIQHRQKIKVSCIAPGYLLCQTYLQAPVSGDVFFDTISMIAIKEHQKMVLQDIEFVSDQAAFMPMATEPLSNLLDFMQSNPKVNILIKGYVNDPAQINSNKHDQNLSEERAMAVQKYLNDNGISLKRIECVGFGNKNMLYPNPTTSEEQQANRRVEIEIE